jgi:mono/diheme cytochrome c family protein
MPALGAAGGSLTDEEVKAVVRYLRSLHAPAPTLEEVTRAASDVDLGARVYRQDCAACHGNTGEGTELGSPLATADRKAAGAAALYQATVSGVPDTAMPRYTIYDARTLASIIAYISGLPRAAGSRTAWKVGEGSPDRGRSLYAAGCAGCHGDIGQGKLGPALANPAFLNIATKAYIAATIVRGRSSTPMPAFGRDSVNYPKLSAAEVLDLAAYVRGGLASGKK